MLSSFLLVFLAAFAGVSVAFQPMLNANLRIGLNSAAWAGVTSYLVGLFGMVLMTLALRDPIPAAALANRILRWTFSGGLFGAIFIGLAIFLVPKLGAANFFVLLVAGRLIASVAFDHFGVRGLVPRGIDLYRVIGIAMLIGGCILVRGGHKQTEVFDSLHHTLDVLRIFYR